MAIASIYLAVYYREDGWRLIPCHSRISDVVFCTTSLILEFLDWEGRIFGDLGKFRKKSDGYF